MEQINSQEIATKLLEKLKEKERIESLKKENEKEISTLQLKLFDKMDSEECEAIKIEGIEFKPASEQQFSLNIPARSWDECPEWFAWLKKIGESGLIKTKESVQWQTRNAFLKEYSENAGLPNFIKESYFNTVKYNKAAIKRLVDGEQKS